ncbi:MAG: glycosyltransferase family 39 protein [Blastocatellia bacterium]|nr:glycosyltransferase family 39 protein [Blastocatellia bacterium]
MQKLLPILLALVFFLAAIGNFPDGAIASLVCVLTVLAWVWIIKYNCEDKKQLSFLISLFLGAVLVRVLYSTIAYYFDFWLYVAGDAETYNGFGNILANYLHGEGVLDEFTKNRFFNLYGSGWGMFWFVGLFYYVVGQNPMAGNFFTLVFGAAAAPFTYFCAKELFNNSKVAKYSALLVAFFPGFINWSSFMMKDGLIILLLVVGIYSILQLQKKFSAGHVVSLLIVFIWNACT